jgi:hypothetical protein
VSYTSIKKIPVKQKYLFSIMAFKNALFYFQDIAFRATPGIRQILKCNTGGDASFRIAL